MNNYIFSNANKFTCIKDPYSADNFVKSTYQDVVGTDAAKAGFAGFVREKKLLAFLMSEVLATQPLPEGGTLEIVDCGVYMGVFTIAAGLMAQEAGLPVVQRSYEANPMLIEPIRHNLEIYGVSAEVVPSGVGGKKEYLEFVHAKGGMIGGTFFSTDNKKASGDFTTVKCPVLPLSDILEDDQKLGMVKLDIEGNEVAALGSIMNSPWQMHNIFIIEYAPWQGKTKLPDEQLFANWLLDNFIIFNVASWLYPSIAEIRTLENLTNCLGGGTRISNTDLLLMPKSNTGAARKLRNGILN